MNLSGDARLEIVAPINDGYIYAIDAGGHRLWRFCFVGFAVAMMVATITFAQKATTDYSKSADFTQYKTFMWIKEPKTTDPLTRQRVIDDVNSALTGRGLQLVTSNADLCVAAHAATKQERTLNTFYNGFGGGWRWGGGFGNTTTTVDTYQVGTLVVDIFDAKTKSWKAGPAMPWSRAGASRSSTT